MRSMKIAMGVVLVAVAVGGVAGAQTRELTPAECQRMRAQMSGHARLSDGVRRLIAAPSPAAPATTPRADVIRARLSQIPAVRSTLESQRAAALKSIDISRVLAVHNELDALEREETELENELAAQLARPPAPVEPERRLSNVEGIRCEDMAAIYENALQIRRKELGARPREERVLPLLALQGTDPDKIGRELNRQFGPWPMASTQLGLLDQDGDGRVDGFVDMPAEGIFRVYRVQSNGAITVESFPETLRAVRANYGEATRRAEERIVAHERSGLAELLREHPVGVVHVVEETADFKTAFNAYLAGNFASGVRQGVATRTQEFKNFRGQSVRIREVITPTPDGLELRHLVMLPQRNAQELWEERTTRLTVKSWSEVEVETAVSRETRTALGELVGTPSKAAPARFTVAR